VEAQADDKLPTPQNICHYKLLFQSNFTEPFIARDNALPGLRRR
jgi:hypothetical protein